ncbi:MAG: hypothetical protein M3077_15165, partial [Candidatus Dormibacteraeota bacterium]|nr:hypothetical protein [Candidatus Dormibacteraeota bacterium]
YFIDAIATRLWSVEGGMVTTHLGNYTDFERRRQRAAARDAAPTSGSPAARAKPSKVMPALRAAAAIGAQVEDQIAEVEQELRDLEARLADHQTYDDPARVSELSRAHREASERLRALYEAWEQASEEPAEA